LHGGIAVSEKHWSSQGWPKHLLLAGFTERKWWHKEQATEAQLNTLARRGWKPPKDLRKGQAWWVIGKPSRRMLQILEDNGQLDLEKPLPDFEEAHEMVGKIAEQEGWKTKPWPEAS
jgi:hypothetical protein